jgi:N6-adenosine-specific RNA methylase IME4
MPKDSALECLAHRINAEHQQVEGALQTSLEHARTAGELLVEAKARCPHGQWLPWLKAAVRFSEATAQRYMQIASRWAELAKSRTVRDLTMRDALRLLATRPAADPGPPAVTAGGAPCTVDELERLVELGRRFGTVLADPPWRYHNRASRGAAENHYPTMTVDEIAALPVEQLAAPQCHLWLWVTNAFLFECPKLFAKWGFEFKTHYVWCKPQMGTGNYLRNSDELLLLAVRGGLVGAAKDVRSWGEYPRGRHSAKPEPIRRKVIERVSPGPRLELFSRAAVDGWTVWGNQIERAMFDHDVLAV